MRVLPLVVVPADQPEVRDPRVAAAAPVRVVMDLTRPWWGMAVGLGAVLISRDDCFGHCHGWLSRRSSDIEHFALPPHDHPTDAGVAGNSSSGVAGDGRARRKPRRAVLAARQGLDVDDCDHVWTPDTGHRRIVDVLEVVAPDRDECDGAPLPDGHVLLAV